MHSWKIFGEEEFPKNYVSTFKSNRHDSYNRQQHDFHHGKQHGGRYKQDHTDINDTAKRKTDQGYRGLLDWDLE